MKKTLLLFILNFLLFSSCQVFRQEYGHSHLEPIVWLEGTWSVASEKSAVQETWAAVSDTLFRGYNYKVLGEDTLILEIKEIAYTQVGLVFSSSKHQDGGKPVQYVHISGNFNELVFQSRNAGFPQRISYMNESFYDMRLSFSGVVNHKPKDIEFKLKRLQKETEELRIN